MRLVPVGLILLSLSIAVHAQAPAEGEVESIGFDGWYRSNCWVPMRVKLRPKTSESRDYKLVVIQDDLDRDRVSYSRPFTLGGNADGRTLEERAWVYFLPQALGLDNVRTNADMSAAIKVFLCDTSGRQLVQISFPPSTPICKNVDQPGLRATFSSPRGVRLVLVVMASGDQPQLDVYRAGRSNLVSGATEEIQFVRVDARDLPGNVLGYAAVDHVIWLNADPATMNADSTASLRDYVRDGGRLLVCQSRDWQKMRESELAPLLPVVITGVEEEQGPISLRKLIELDQDNRHPSLLPIRAGGQETEPWSDLDGKTIPIARATAKPGALVNLWSESKPDSPYLARWMYGMGIVAWAAQDFGDPSLISRARESWVGWARVWDRACDWPNDTVVFRQDLEGAPPEIRRPYQDALKKYDAHASYTDLSTALLRPVEHTGTGAALTALAILFFLGYWLVAGPGSYFFLLAKKRAHYSWVAFALCAFAATGLTAAVVRVVLRGPPEVKHLSFVRIAPDEDAIVRSDVGIYIKRDGAQRIRIRDTAPKRISYIAPYAGHAVHIPSGGEYPAPLEYEVPVPDRNSADIPSVDVPYRSTSKKFQVKWIGRLPQSLEGQVRIDSGRLSGRLTNNTGLDLQSVFFIHRVNAAYPSFNTFYPDDRMYQLADRTGASLWPKGQTLNVSDLDANSIAPDITGLRPPDLLALRGYLNLNWIKSWSPEFLDGREVYSNTDRAALLLSLFDRLAPVEVTEGRVMGTLAQVRFEFQRPAGRHADASASISAGHLLVFARAEGPVPFPLEIESRPAPGKGLVYYQFVVPVQRGGSSSTAVPVERER